MYLENNRQRINLVIFVCLFIVSTCRDLSFKKEHIDVERNQRTVVHMSRTTSEPKQSWGYVTVRPKAHEFYWLYYTTHSSGYKERPLILWLQGGPGASGTGFGNFEEIGPLDVNLNTRNTTWLQTASLLFIDNPVGTGYSYVEDNDAYTTNVAQISADLLVVLKAFVTVNPDFSATPFYIFSESYGGKMAAAFSAVLYDAAIKGDIKINFKGFAMGDSWISPVDSTSSWGPYLYATSIVDSTGLDKINVATRQVAELVKEGKYSEATDAWGDAESTVELISGGVNFYNILDWSGSDNKRKSAALDSRSSLEKLYDRHVKHMANDDLDALMNGPIKKKLKIIPQNVTWGGKPYDRRVKHMANDDLDALMNGPIKKKLKIIPQNVTWGGQSGEVFTAQSGDFMKNVTATVNHLIQTTPLKVIVYSGQLDLICDVLGTEAWFSKLDISTAFNKATRQLVACDKHPIACFYVKEVKNVQFYWILQAGHMVPSDNGSGALKMVDRIIE